MSRYDRGGSERREDSEEMEIRRRPVLNNDLDADLGMFDDTVSCLSDPHVFAPPGTPQDGASGENRFKQKTTSSKCNPWRIPV